MDFTPNDLRSLAENYYYHGFRTTKTVKSTIETAYLYYKDISSYSSRYSKYCEKIDVLLESELSLKTKELWRIPIKSEKTHLPLITIQYNFSPTNEITYEFMDGYEPIKGIKNKIVFETKTDGSTIVKGDIPVMFIASLLGQFDKDSEQYHFYTEMVMYFNIRDGVDLEGKKGMEPFKVGNLCTKCGKGHLEFFYKPSDSRGGNVRTRTDSWKCDSCGQIFTAFNVTSYDDIFVN